MGKKIIVNGEETEDRRQGERRKNNNRVVSWQVFVWALGIIFLVFMILFGLYRSLNVNVQAAITNNNEIKIQLREIQTDVKWIKEALKER